MSTTSSRLRGSRAARLVFLLGVAPIGVLHGQEYKSPIWGGSGGTASYNLDCGSTGVMTGFFGKAGSWIDQVGITCRTVNADGSLGSTFTRGPSGGAGGTGYSGDCPSGWVVGRAHTYSGTFMNSLRIYCYPWSSATRRADYGTTPRSGGDLGGYFAGVTVNNPSTCPAEKVGKALRGKYGWYIDSMQFVCDDYNK